MARYKDADVLIELATNRGFLGNHFGDVVKAYVNACPPADVRPNVRGEWVEDELGITVCSNCKNSRRDNRIKHIAFCNSCGADMRGDHSHE